MNSSVTRRTITAGEPGTVIPLFPEGPPSAGPERPETKVTITVDIGTFSGSGLASLSYNASEITSAGTPVIMPFEPMAEPLNERRLGWVEIDRVTITASLIVALVSSFALLAYFGAGVLIVHPAVAALLLLGACGFFAMSKAK